MLFANFLKRFVETGHLHLTDADGTTFDFGTVGAEPSVSVRLHDPAVSRKLAINPKLYVGEAYMDGKLTIEEGDLRDFFALVGANMPRLYRDTRLSRIGAFLRRNFLRPLQQHNPVGKAQKNVAHHYDLSDDLFDLFLDEDRQYSCAYFATPNSTLEQAQADKKRHLASKMLLEPGQKVLDIGSGWGGMALYLAKTADVDVTGVTLSKEQYQVSNARAQAAGLSDRVRFHLKDYRELDQTFDRIVSVGMFEHVGATHYIEFFRKVRSLLTDDGVCVLHSIGRLSEPGTTNPWMRKYIFPGGYAPALSEVMTAVERSRLVSTDIEILRLHYADTLKHWWRRFTENRERIQELYDERFCRMWEFYLLACENAFRNDDQIVFQLQFSKKLTTVPLTRDYMTEWERTHA
jgi:cyclopropane-fatty-acyl-phospholipid synthase